jgi:predicted acetyltransferase
MLWASEERIYGRYGYGAASLALNGEIDVRRMDFRNDVRTESRARLVTADEAYDVVPAIYERVRDVRPGMVSRSENWWRVRRLADAPRAPSSLFRAVLEIDGVPEAYALYRVKMDFEEWGAEADVYEALGTSLAAERELWRYLLGIDLVGTLKANWLPVDHALVLMVQEPRKLGLRLQDALWVRIVDVESALNARTYAADRRVVVDVQDELCPWNAGRWEIEGERAARSDREPDLRCDVNALGSAYLGGFTWGELVRSGHAEEVTPGAAWEADAIFRTGPKPWCPEIF